MKLWGEVQSHSVLVLLKLVWTCLPTHAERLHALEVRENAFTATGGLIV